MFNIQAAFKFITLSLALLFVGGCASGLGGDVYSRDQTREAQTVQRGTIESVRQVQIEGTKSQVGTFAGAVLGGIGGSALGGGRGSAIFAVLGALGGGAAGAAAEEVVTRQKGLEIIVKLDSGGTVAVVQTMDKNYARPYYAGEKVRVMSSHSSARVVHM